MQDCISSNKIKENKYKILRMSLLLGSGVDREDTFNNFEDAAREIDAMNDEVYLKNIEDKFYDTLKLEEEEEKLTVLVDYIGGRVEQRISLLSDFANVTGYDLQNLPPIKYYDKLDDYKDRLSYIREYLSNIEQIEMLSKEIENFDKQLNDAYLNRASSEEYNQKIENTLLDKFVSVFKTLDFFKEVNEGNIDEILNDIVYKVEDSKKSLDIFAKSFSTLSGSGISMEEEEEYLSYVENAKGVYYSYKEQEFVLRLYKLLLSKYSDYSQILYKREEINDILYERLKLRKELKVSGNDILSTVYDLLERQYDDIKRQSVDIENIDKFTNAISSKKEELNRLELENQKVEILSLLREFCIIDTYSEVSTDNTDSNYQEEVESNYEESVDLVDNNEFNSIDVGLGVDLDADLTDNLETDLGIKLDSKQEEILPVDDVVLKGPIFDENTKDNQVVFVEDAKLVDLDLIHSKASKVMKRVGEMLGIKVEETKVVSVTNNEEKNLFMNDDVSKESSEINNDIGETNNEIIENPLFSDDVVDSGVNDNLFNDFDNDLFSGNTDDVEDDVVSENPLFSSNELEVNNDLSNSEFSFPNTDSNDFWFSSDTPDALNELPDLNVSNDDFFANNSVADLEFPDLNMDFPNIDTEEKI